MVPIEMSSILIFAIDCSKSGHMNIFCFECMQHSLYTKHETPVRQNRQAKPAENSHRASNSKAIIVAALYRLGSWCDLHFPSIYVLSWSRLHPWSHSCLRRAAMFCLLVHWAAGPIVRWFDRGWRGRWDSGVQRKLHLNHRTLKQYS